MALAPACVRAAPPASGRLRVSLAVLGHAPSVPRPARLPCRGAHTGARFRGNERQVPANVKEQTTSKHASVEVEMASLSAALATFKELKAAGN